MPEPRITPSPAIPFRRAGRNAVLACVALILACASAVAAASTVDPATAPLSVRIYADRMTVRVAGAAQVYVSGVIDTAAPARVAAQLDDRHIADGADVYLDATGPDAAAGMALGRIFRARSMSTHLGVPSRGRRAKRADKAATCTGACAFAYLGGTYRWVPTGRDRYRITLPAASVARDDAALADAYLREMGMDPARLPAPDAEPDDAAAWPGSDAMIAAGLANNGRLPMVASYRMAAGTPRLDLDQQSRGGERRITLQCKVHGVAFTAYDQVGASHARHIAGHAARSYVAVGARETQAQGGIEARDDALVLTRVYPRGELDGLLAAPSLGVWTADAKSPLRYGFEFSLSGISRVLSAFRAACMLPAH